MDMHAIPFESHMLRDARTFVGRWSELQLLVNAVDQRRPAIVIAPPRSGRSSLLFHAIAAGPVLFDTDDLPAFYLDMAEFPDLNAVQTTIAEAFAPAGTPWLQAVLRANTAPLLAFDNIDAVQFAAYRDDWFHLLATEVQAGRLRVIAAAASGAVTVGPEWAQVSVAPVGQVFLGEYLDVTLPDGPLPSRGDQQAIVTLSHGHLGTLIVVLSLWFRAQMQPGFDWRTVAAQLPIPMVDGGSIPRPALPASDHTDGAQTPNGGELQRPTNRAVASAVPASSPFTVGNTGWLVVAALLLVIVVWYWGSR